ncbi:YdeI/OmpD-associated family protein [Patescibacteria group bacterium]|nr:YdeI/OmpD-associated family protein [Patescibacteria group bacterium]
MLSTTISNGTAHKLTPDIRQALMKSKGALAAWESLTPLARNEWICWVTFVKKVETRQEHVERMIDELKEGQRRPCCWLGCTHRTDKKISPSVQGILNRKGKKSTK